MDGDVSPALIASDSIWAVAEKALQIVGRVERVRMDLRKSITCRYSYASFKALSEEIV